MKSSFQKLIVQVFSWMKQTIFYLSRIKFWLERICSFIKCKLVHTKLLNQRKVTKLRIKKNKVEPSKLAQEVNRFDWRLWNTTSTPTEEDRPSRSMKKQKNEWERKSGRERERESNSSACRFVATQSVSQSAKHQWLRQSSPVLSLLLYDLLFFLTFLFLWETIGSNRTALAAFHAQTYTESLGLAEKPRIIEACSFHYQPAHTFLANPQDCKQLLYFIFTTFKLRKQTF